MALKINWVERFLYDAGGHTGSAYYIRIVRRRDGSIWHPYSKTLKAVASITWAQSVILLVEEGQTGVFPIVIPHDWRTRDDIAREDYGKAYADIVPSYGNYGDLTTSEKAIVDTQIAQKASVDVKYAAIGNIPGDTYDIIAYKQLGSDPAKEDDVEKQWEAKLGGDIFGF